MLTLHDCVVRTSVPTMKQKSVPISITVVMVCTTVQTLYDLICYNAQDPSEDGHAASETRVMQ